MSSFDFLQTVFGGDVPQRPLELLQIAARAFLLYVFGLALVRIGKSRLMAHHTPMDILVAIILGSLLSRGVTGSASLSGTAVSSAVLVACHWILTWIACKSHAVGNVVKGHVKLLVSEGAIDWNAMRGSHISEEDLREGMRHNGNVDDLSRVKRAYKERSGEISIVRRSTEPRIVELGVQDGVKTIRIEVSGN